MRPQLQTADALVAGAFQATRRVSEALLSQQSDQGYWWAHLTADTTLESDFILLQLWLDPPQKGVWKPKKQALIDKAVRSILRRQLEDGGFNIYAGGPAEVSATVKAYFALKLAGVSADDPRMVKARDCILAMGGAIECKSTVGVGSCFVITLPLKPLQARNSPPVAPTHGDAS